MDNEQPIIVVATRGGEGSHAARMAAAAAAKAEDAKLILLYIVDTTQLETDAIMSSAVVTELTWLGEVLLELSRKRLADFGVSAETFVLEGNVRNQINAFVRERKVDILYLGAPRGTTYGLFGDDEIEKFALDIEGMAGIKVIVARPEDIVEETASQRQR